MTLSAGICKNPQLGKAIKTLFLCRYLHEETLRREIHEGLNVIEQWNGANDFVFFARRGELASNRTEDHELSMLALHLLQNCMVYINTLMMQQVLARPHWAKRLTATDLRAVTPLIWEHVNPRMAVLSSIWKPDSISVQMAPGDTTVGRTPMRGRLTKGEIKYGKDE